MLPAMLLYLIYFLLQTSIRSNGAKGKLDPMVWTWFVNSLYILLALGLNLWDTVPCAAYVPDSRVKEPSNAGVWRS
jgi:lipopolysaccharide export system permease protein